MPLLFFTHNNRIPPTTTWLRVCRGVCSHGAFQTRTFRARPEKIHRSTHTETERDPNARARSFASNNAPRKMRVTRDTSDESFVFDFKVSFRTSGYILSFQIFPLFESRRHTSYFLTPSPDATPTRTRPDRIDVDTPFGRRLAFYEKHSRGRRGVEKTRSRSAGPAARRGLLPTRGASAVLLFLLELFPSRFLSKRRRVLFRYLLWFYQAPVSLFAWICTQILRGL